jgi:hypothetical protein
VRQRQHSFPEVLLRPSERFKILNRIAELIDDNLDALALAKTNDNGKPLWISKKVDILVPPLVRVSLGSASCKRRACDTNDDKICE